MNTSSVSQSSLVITQSITSSVDELNALRFASRFVVRKTLKKYEKRSDEVANQFLVCLLLRMMLKAMTY